MVNRSSVHRPCIKNTQTNCGSEIVAVGQRANVGTQHSMGLAHGAGRLGWVAWGGLLGVVSCGGLARTLVGTSEHGLVGMGWHTNQRTPEVSTKRADEARRHKTAGTATAGTRTPNREHGA